MKQKVVIKLSLEGHKSRSKALKIAVGVSGVESAALKDDKNQIEVTGDGMDAVVLTSLLRKKVGYAELVSVGPAGGEKKDENKPKDPVVKIEPPPYWPPYQGPWVPHYEYHVVNPDPCSIM